MASVHTNVFTDTETNNWFKACIALNVTKEGLADFVETQLQQAHISVGNGCGNCCIENLMSCPTQGLCKKKGTGCTFHKGKQPKPCQICNRVLQSISLLHRYPRPSWLNTKAEKWGTDPWEIGKCFLPPDGYSGVSSVQNSDFNGLISVMLNCKHFETCLATSLTPNPPDPHCPLEQVRQIGRDVRHTGDCKVIDAKLHDYFQQLIRLLNDPACLVNDPSAQKAHQRLIDLQNDSIPLTELGTMMKGAIQDLEHAKEATEKRFLDRAKQILTDGLNKIATTLSDAEQNINRMIGDKIIDAENKISEKKNDATEEIKMKLKDSFQKLDEQTRNHIQRIQQAATENKAKEDYENDKEGLLIDLKQFYDERFSHVKTSTLRDDVDDKLSAIYMPPDVRRMVVEYGRFNKTDTRITKYKDIFPTNDKLKQRTYIQGEAGCGKTTFSSKLLLDWCAANASESASSDVFFDDATTLQKYKFIFYITLRDSVSLCDVAIMIKEQLIDKMYAFEEDRKKTYTLLNRIMKDETCLLVLDGLDEWLDPKGTNPLPTIATCYRKCSLLITTRPWKLAGAAITNSQIDTLLKLEGINEPFKVCERVLERYNDSKASKESYKKLNDFKTYIADNHLLQLLSFPMMLPLIVSSWAQGTELKGSKCQIYTILVECLVKKANSHTKQFQQSPVQCFKDTQYIQPNIEHLKCLAEAAFYFLFSQQSEKSLVFSSQELEQYISDQTKEFALKAGILSVTKGPVALRPSSTFTFIHKSVQEFFAALHIANKNTHVIDDVISRYIASRQNAYLDMSEVFIFECGLNISEAFKLSRLLDERYSECYFNTLVNKMKIQGMFQDSPFQRLLNSGYKEAAANNTKDLPLYLSNFNFAQGDDVNILLRIFKCNVPNIRSLIFPYPIPSQILNIHLNASPSSSCQALDFSECYNLELLELDVFVPKLSNILRNLKKLKHLRISCAFKDLDLQSFEHLESLYIEEQTSCGSVILNKTLKEIRIRGPINGIDLLPCEHLNVIYVDRQGTLVPNSQVRSKHVKRITIHGRCDGLDLSLCEHLESINLGDQVTIATASVINYTHLKQLKLKCKYDGLDLSLLEHVESFEIGKQVRMLRKPLSKRNAIKRIQLHKFDFTCLETSDILLMLLLKDGDSNQCGDIFPVLSRLQTITLCGVKFSTSGIRPLFKTLLTLGHSVKCSLRKCDINGRQVSANIVTDLNNMFAIRDINRRNLCLLDALHGLNIKTLHLGGTEIDFGKNPNLIVSHSLSSLTELKTLKLNVNYDYDSGLWTALDSLIINNLSLSLSDSKFTEFEDLTETVGHASSLSQSLASLTQLITLRVLVKTNNDCPGLWRALNGLNIIDLSLDIRNLEINVASSLSQSLSSLRHLESLRMQVGCYTDYADLWECLDGLNIKTLSRDVRTFDMICATSLSQSLSLLTALEKIKIQVGVETDFQGLWEALDDAHITNLSLDIRCMENNPLSSMSKSLSSLTNMETLRIMISVTSACSDLWEALHGLNIKTLILNVRDSTRICASSLSQLLLSLTNLKTLKIHLRSEIDLQLPQSLSYLYWHCEKLSPCEFLTLMTQLAGFGHPVKCKLTFGCSNFENDSQFEYPLEQYLQILEEPEAKTFVKTVKTCERLGQHVVFVIVNDSVDVVEFYNFAYDDYDNDVDEKEDDGDDYDFDDDDDYDDTYDSDYDYEEEGSSDFNDIDNFYGSSDDNENDDIDYNDDNDEEEVKKEEEWEEEEEDTDYLNDNSTSS
ncbi:uncharacterized protein LOC127856012 [Dreissena polymorpha]|uniref:NACHT domain-containing protein n=1 Tax=Dreissena polymorpha TaxID=45954 RepID=A0A9D4HGU0_DREPO|nr:uncharacterized protein LOC127856012 [Dreissena polymorpha]KAH3718520.1 hypothetical protein DPMN_061325 [Dreissena polymorpha]